MKLIKESDNKAIYEVYQRVANVKPFKLKK